ncbi:MAG: CDP-alcohol phosphatidyltransferase family protein [Rickettsiales bacterium]|jgi:phosphatidylglycerophosphate synthase|nr:CDP-alcohol phosphatidyltransferase family protein [Rickettsiales bacterium]
MLDPFVRKIIDPVINSIGNKLVSLNISANSITILGFIMGLLAMLTISINQYNIAIIFIGLNRLADGLDGAIARNSQLTDFGGFLDIVCDFIIYSGIVFAFTIADPENTFYAAFLIFSFIGPISSFLAYAIIAAKRKIDSTLRGEKSFYYLGGVCEGTETAATLLLLCIFPNYFNIICLIYGSLCWITTFGRIYNAWVDFR